ncbi:MAG: ankyrin repeat domain-containing protein, partial [archaeon]|nr:ankyrin repeat domain-containing protein [archaeon]
MRMPSISSMKKLSLQDFAELLAHHVDSVKSLKRQQSHTAVAEASLSRGHQGLFAEQPELLMESLRRLRGADKQYRELQGRLAAAEERVDHLKEQQKKGSERRQKKAAARSDADLEKDLRAQLFDMHERYEELELRAESRVTQMGILLKESEERANKARDTATRALNRIAKAEREAKEAGELVARLNAGHSGIGSAASAPLNPTTASAAAAAAAAAVASGGPTAEASLYLEEIHLLTAQLATLQGHFDGVQDQLQKERARCSLLSIERSTAVRIEKIATITLNLLQTARSGAIVLPENMVTLIEQLDDTLQQALQAKEKQTEPLRAVLESPASSFSSLSQQQLLSATGPTLASLLDIDLDQEVIQIILLEARGLHWSRVDPLCKISFGGRMLSSSPLSKSHSTSGWLEAFLLPLPSPPSSPATPRRTDIDIVLENVKGEKPEVLGTAVFSFESLVSQQKVEKWLELSLPGVSRTTRGPAVYLSFLKTTHRHILESGSSSSSSSSASMTASSSSSASSSNLVSPTDPLLRFDPFATLLRSLQDSPPASQEETSESEIHDAKDAANALPFPRLDLVARHLREQKEIDTSWTNENDQTYLHLMVAHGDLELVKATAGAKALAKVDYNGLTPAHVAAFRGHLQALEHFFAAYSFDVNLQTQNRLTALHLAVLGGHLDVVRFLVHSGARVNHQDKNGATALMMATYLGHTAIVELLLDNDADARLQDKYKNTALLLAYLQGRFELAPLLAESRSLDLANAMGETPLWGLLLHHRRLSPSSLEERLQQVGPQGINQTLGKHELGVLHRALIQLDDASCASLLPLL